MHRKHFEGLQGDVDAGFLKVGGAILEEVPQGDEALKFAGSALVCVAGSKEEIIEKLKKDIYAEHNVWDFSKVRFVRVSSSNVSAWLIYRTGSNLSVQVCLQISIEDINRSQA